MFIILSIIRYHVQFMIMYYHLLSCIIIYHGLIIIYYHTTGGKSINRSYGFGYSTVWLPGDS